MIIMRVIEMIGGGIEVSLVLCALSPRRYSCYIYLLSHGLCSKSGEASLENLLQLNLSHSFEPLRTMGAVLTCW